MRSNGSHHHSEAIVDRLVGAGLIQDADRGDSKAVDAALGKLLDSFAAAQPNPPLPGFFVTPQVETSVNNHLIIALMEVLVALGVIPPEAVAAVLVHCRATGAAAHAPAAFHQLVGHTAELLQWSLRRHGGDLDANAIRNWNAR